MKKVSSSDGVLAKGTNLLLLNVLHETRLAKPGVPTRLQVDLVVFFETNEALILAGNLLFSLEHLSLALSEFRYPFEQVFIRLLEDVEEEGVLKGLQINVAARESLPQLVELHVDEPVKEGVEEQVEEREVEGDVPESLESISAGPLLSPQVFSMENHICYADEDFLVQKALPNEGKHEDEKQQQRDEYSQESALLSPHHHKVKQEHDRHCHQAKGHEKPVSEFDEEQKVLQEEPI